MNLDPAFVSSLLQAVGLGFGAVLLLWLLRRYRFVRRLWVSVLGLALAAGVYMVLRAADVPADHLSVQIISAIAIFLSANVILKVLDMLL